MTPTVDIVEPPGRVLIVDDESTNRELLEVMLASEGHLLVTAASGEEALALVALEPPDVILLDIMMPGMDGHKVAAKLKSNPATKNIPIIMVTALDSRYDRILGLSAGAEEFLTKPVDRVELCVRVRNLLRLKAYGDFYDKYSQTLQAEVSARTADLAERTNSLDQQLLLRERLSLATAVARVGVWDWDLASNTLTWDATMFDIYGCVPSVPMPYGRWAAAVHPDDLPAVQVGLKRTIDEKGQGSAQYRVIRPDGSIRHVSAVERAVLDERAKVTRLIGVNMDVTDRVHAEGALEQIRQDQLQFKDDFLSHVSHELRSPLTAIKQFTTILLGGLAGELNKEQGEYQLIVLKNIGQLQSMIDDLLEVTRLETGKLTVESESVSVSSVVTDTFDTLQGSARAKGVALSCDLTPGLPNVHADPTRLRQILIILLDNALKFTPDGGAVAVHAQLLPQDPRFLRIEVSDTGCGINPETADRLFERLYQVGESIQASRKGLGLGLYICKELVTRQGGQIWARRRTDKGSIFSFTLPVFSLNRVIAPLLKEGKWPANSAALVTLETCVPGSRQPNESGEEWALEARSLLQGCVLPNLDLVLPKMTSDAEGERFFVAAFTDEKGAAVIANRIRDHFERLPQLKHTGRTLSVSHRMLPLLPNDVGASAETLVTRMATLLEESIESQTLIEAVRD